MVKITFEDKVDYTTKDVPEINKITSDNINSIKTVVNQNVDQIVSSSSDITSLQVSVNALTSGIAYSIPQEGNTPANEPAPIENGIYRVNTAGTFTNWGNTNIPTLVDKVVDIQVTDVDTTPVYTVITTDLSITADTVPTSGSTNAVQSGGVKTYVDNSGFLNQFFKEDIPKQLDLGINIRAYNYETLTSSRAQGDADVTKNVVNGFVEFGNISGTSIKIVPSYDVKKSVDESDIGRVWEVFCKAKDFSTNGFGVAYNRAGTDYNLIYRGNGQILEGINDSFSNGATIRGSAVAYEFVNDDLISLKIYKKSSTQTFISTSKNGVYSDEIIRNDTILVDGISYAFKGNGVMKDPYFKSYIIDNSEELATIEAERLQDRKNILADSKNNTINGVSAINAKILSSLNKIFISKNGNDTTGDGSEFNPYLTFKKATEIATATIGSSIIVSDQNQYNFVRGAAFPNGLNIAGLPSFGENNDVLLAPIKSLSELTWTLDSGNIWTADYVLTNIPPTSILNGATANSFHFAVYDENYNKLEWFVGGVDIATNKANMTANSMVCHFNGSTTQDLRSDIAGVSATIKLFVWLADGSDPNGKDLKAIDYQTIASGNGDITGSISGLITGYNYRKDNINVNPDTLGNAAKIGTLKSYQCPSHGFVGLASVFGKYEYIGRGIEGATGYKSATGVVINRSSGGGMTLYTGTFYPNLILQHAVLIIKNASNAIYGHGSSANKGYKAVNIKYLEIENSNNCVKFDKVPTGGFPFVTDKITIDFMDAKNVDGGFLDTGNLEVKKGFLNASKDVETINTPFFILVQNTITTEPLIWTIKDFVFKNEKSYTSFSSNIRLIDTSASVTGIHTLILDNFIDESEEDKQLHLPRVAGLHPVHLVLKNGTVLGDLQPNNVVVWPEQLTIEAGVTFGFDGRDFATLITDLNSAGVTHNLSDFTADDITLVKGRTK